LLLKREHFHQLVITYIKKGLQPFNLFNNNEYQLEQKQALQMQIESDLPRMYKSEVFLEKAK
jgi:hypothetical protein